MKESTEKVFRAIDCIIRLIGDRRHMLYEIRVSDLTEKEKLDKVTHLLIGIEKGIKAAHDGIAASPALNEVGTGPEVPGPEAQR